MDIKEFISAAKQQDFPAWATEATLQKLVAALGQKGTVGDFAKSIGRNGDRNPRTLIGGLNHATTSLSDMNKGGMQVAKTFKSFAAGAGGILATFAQTKGRFSDLNPIISSVSSGLQSIADSIPFVGGVIKGFVKLGEEVAKLNNAIVDDLLDNFYALGKAGFNLNSGLQQLQIDATAAGISFGAFSGVIQQNIKGILSLGGDIERGSRMFVDTLTHLTQEDSQFARSLKSFGLGAEETAAFLGDFVDQNRNSLLLQGKSSEEVAQIAFDYAKNLRVISELTGMEIDAIKEAQMAQVADGAFQGKLQEMRNAGMVEEARLMEEHAAALDAIDPSGALSQAYKEQITFGTAVTQASALLMRTLPQLEQAFAAQSVDGAIDAMKNLTTQTDSLRIAQLGMLENGNPLSDLITSLLPQAQFLATKGVTFAELVDQQNKQIENLGRGDGAIATFEEQLIETAHLLEVLPLQMQSFVIKNLASATGIQVAIIKGFISQFQGALGGSTMTSGYDVTEVVKAKAEGGTPMIGQFTEAGDQIYVDDKGIPFTMQDGVRTDLNQNYGGGPAGGGLYMVGERGPELLRLNQGSMGHVYNHGQTKSMLSGRFGGGPVGGAQLSTIQMGDMGSRQVDAQGMTQALHMGLDADTTLSYFKNNGTLEIVRALMSVPGASIGVSGSEQSGKFDKSFYQAPDGSRIYGAEGQTAAYKAIQQSDQTALPPARSMEELVNIQKDLAKYTKKMLAKIASGDGYF